MENKPAMTGNGKHTTYKNGDDWGMVQMALFYRVGLDPRDGYPMAWGTRNAGTVAGSGSTCKRDAFVLRYVSYMLHCLKIAYTSKSNDLSMFIIMFPIKMWHLVSPNFHFHISTSKKHRSSSFIRIG